MVLHVRVKHATFETAYMNALIIHYIKYQIIFIKYIPMTLKQFLYLLIEIVLM